MRLVLPHLPNKIDVKIYNCVRDFFVCPKKCLPFKISEMSKSRSSNKKPIDLKTIHGVVRSGDLKLVENFIQENGLGILNTVDAEGYTPMHWAALEGTLEIARFIIEKDAEYDNYQSNPNGQRPIHWACAKGRIDIVTLLLEKGVDINVQDNKGNTPLIAACQHGQQWLVAFLVGRGANIEIDDFNGDSALHWAAYKGFPELTRLLIIYGVYSKKIDNYGQTVLHLACLGGNLNIVQKLVENEGLDPEIRDKNGKKAIDLARARHYSNITDYLTRYSESRRGNFCNYKTLLFGPVGNSKLVFLIVHLLFWLYQYPVYYYRVMPVLWESHFWLQIAYFILNIIMWGFYYAVHLTEPGYLKQNTAEYQERLRNITFKSPHFSPEDWERNLNKLCHTCKAVKPLRVSHCRACNRCVLAFDHHCPYVQNCIGFKNRQYFFGYVYSTVFQQIIVAQLLYYVMSREGHHYIFYPAVTITAFFLIMVSFLAIGQTMASLVNLTTNELAKQKRYDYIQPGVLGSKIPKSLFNKGFVYNFKYYFHLIEPSSLEREGFESYNDHVV